MKNPHLTPYAPILTEATKVTDPSELAAIEHIMRHIIHDGTLGHLTRDELMASARMAVEIQRRTLA